MSENQSDLDLLLSLLRIKCGPAGVPLHRVFEELRGRLGGPDRVEKVVRVALERGLVDKVVDYEDAKPSPILPCWHLKLLDANEQQRMQSLTALERALLRLLWQQNDSRHLGQLPVEEVKDALRKEGFGEEDLGVVDCVLTDLVHWYLAFDTRHGSPTFDKDVAWLGIIEEGLRHPSPEYVEAMRKADEEFMEKEFLRERLLEEEEKEERRRQKRRNARQKRTRSAVQQAAHDPPSSNRPQAV
jgi:hypothetical protein